MSTSPGSQVVCARCGTQFDPKLELRFCGTCGTDLSSQSPAPQSLPPASLNDEANRDTQRAQDPLIGEVLDNRYKILESIGQGGMGKVYLVEHQQMSKRMAMKLLHRELANNREVARRFRREALAISRLTSPHTVQVFDFGQGPFGMYLVMELLRGEDLGKIIAREGKLTLPRTVDLLCQAATALQEAHAQGIVHRDLKPENLFITRSHTNTEHLKILDFGLAKLQSGANEETAHGRLLGTPYYMSPEQIRGAEVDPRTDVYAMGALFHKMLTGEPPYKADSPLGVLSRHVSDPIPKLKDRLPEASGSAQRLLERFLAKDPNKRPSSAAEAKKLLQDLLHESIDPTQSEAPKKEEPSAVLPLEEGLATRADWNDFAYRQQRRRRTGALLPFLFVGLLVGAAVYGFRDTLFPGEKQNIEESEPNNDYRTATPINANQPMQGFIGKRINEDTPDRDLYKLTLDPKKKYKLDVDCTGIPNINLRLDAAITEEGAAKLLEPYGDDKGRGKGESFSVEVQAPVVYILVREIKLNDAVIENVSDPYQLTVRLSEPSTLPAVPPNPFDVPEAIASGLPVEGYINSAFTFDVYRLTSTGKKLTVRLSPIQGLDTILELHSADRKLIESADKGATGQGEELSSVNIPEGEPPFIVVRKKSGQSEGIPYSIEVAVK